MSESKTQYEGVPRSGGLGDSPSTPYATSARLDGYDPSRPSFGVFFNHALAQYTSQPAFLQRLQASSVSSPTYNFYDQLRSRANKEGTLSSSTHDSSNTLTNQSAYYLPVHSSMSPSCATPTSSSSPHTSSTLFSATASLSIPPSTTDASNEADLKAFARSPAYRILSCFTTHELCALSRLSYAVSILRNHPLLWRTVDLTTASPYSPAADAVVNLLFPESPIPTSTPSTSTSSLSQTTTTSSSSSSFSPSSTSSVTSSLTLSQSNSSYLRSSVNALNFKGLSSLTNTTLVHYLRHFPTITSLELEGLHRSLDDSSLLYVASLRQLTHLNLSGCIQTKADTIAEVLRSCSKLQTLKLASLNCVNDSLLALIGQHPSIKHVILDSCHNITDQGLYHLARGRNTHLTTLHLAYCERLTDKGMEVLAQCCPNLLDLNLYSVRLITDTGVFMILRFCQSLTSLNLSLIPNLTRQAIYSICYHRHLHQTEQPAYDAIKPSPLERLALYGVKLPPELIVALESCPNLVELDLFGQTLITREAIARLVWRLKRLRLINIGGCPAISAQDVAELAKIHKSVRFLR